MRRKGFTLVELLIVIIIIGILATMAIPQYNRMVGRARISEGVSILSSVLSAAMLYYVANPATTNSSVKDYLTDLDVSVDIGAAAKWNTTGYTIPASSLGISLARVGATTLRVRGSVNTTNGSKVIEQTVDGGTNWTTVQ